MQVSSLLSRYAETIAQGCGSAATLDLACGTGRNGLYLLGRNIPVVFADRNGENLEQITKQLEADHLSPRKHLARLWQVDLEVPGTRPLTENSYGAIVVFRYLHRPLLEGIARALIPGGLLIYETFTVGQEKFGRPKNPDFLLREGELKECFSHWNILHDFEGVRRAAGSGPDQAIAQLVAQKPAAR